MMTKKPLLQYTAATVIALLATAAFAPRQALAHCEVPCGIYGDQLRFESMLEDQKTIAKANGEIANHLKTMEEGATPLAANQIARWVSTKEDHATRIQNVIAQYFMTQRIKPGADEAGNAAYVKKLTAAHAVMQAAMKTKQAPDAETADALRTAILDFYRAYEGKEPAFD